MGHEELTARRKEAAVELAALCLHVNAHPSGNGGFDCRACGGRNVKMLDPAVCVRLVNLRTEVNRLDALIAQSPAE